METGIAITEAQQVAFPRSLLWAADLAKEVMIRAMEAQAVKRDRAAPVPPFPLAAVRSSQLPCFQKKRECSCFSIETMKSSQFDEEPALCEDTAILYGSLTACTKDTHSDDYLFCHQSG